MWSLFLAPLGPCHLLVPKQATPIFKVLVPTTISATAQPQRRRSLPLQNEEDVSTRRQFGEWGHTLLAAFQSNPRATNPVPTSQEEKPQRRKQESEGGQISGSDVLWALQKATARKKNKKKKQRREPSSVRSRGEESAVDYANVRPLCIKSEWGTKLDELEKRLRELSEII